MDATVLREAMIEKKLEELGYTSDDINKTYLDDHAWKWNSLILQPRPLTERIWNKTRPQLEETIRLRRQRREERIRKNKPLRIAELTNFYDDYRKTYQSPNLLPQAILASVPGIHAALSDHEYSYSLNGIFGSKNRILSQLPTTLKRFHRMVMEDYIEVLAREGDSSFRTNDKWVERFTALDEEDVFQLTFWEPEPRVDQIVWVKRALSFVDTPQGICSYDMLEAVGWWTPLSPAPLPVIHIANMIVRQLGLSIDISMSQMMSYGCTFLCNRCENPELMCWISLVSIRRRKALLLLKTHSLISSIISRINRWCTRMRWRRTACLAGKYLSTIATANQTRQQ
ncbi:hypothetical protein SCHPADRAFT_717760 [Schizopora paradoxa]|uniref:Uncharacterized protein n=1 Tax=Schizopora paradoxa TaxID=27342 RepID=A0A0H2R2S7_9AGAM|nr:hypothetical protein SCHPADRAFT_717760 [Schizopora paradoxa]